MDETGHWDGPLTVISGPLPFPQLALFLVHCEVCGSCYGGVLPPHGPRLSRGKDCELHCLKT